MGQKLSRWKEKRHALHEEERKRKVTYRPHEDYTIGDSTTIDASIPLPAPAPAPPPVPVAGAATAHSISMLRSLVPEEGSHPANHEAPLLLGSSEMTGSGAMTGPGGAGGTRGTGGYAYAGTAQGGYGLMGGDYTGGNKNDGDDMDLEGGGGGGTGAGTGAGGMGGGMSSMGTTGGGPTN